MRVFAKTAKGFAITLTPYPSWGRGEPNSVSKTFADLLICIGLSTTSDQFFERGANWLASRARLMSHASAMCWQQNGRQRRRLISLIYADWLPH